MAFDTLESNRSPTEKAAETQRFVNMIGKFTALELSPSPRLDVVYLTKYPQRHESEVSYGGKSDTERKYVSSCFSHLYTQFCMTRTEHC